MDELESRYLESKVYKYTARCEDRRDNSERGVNEAAAYRVLFDGGMLGRYGQERVYDNEDKTLVHRSSGR